MLDGRRRSLKVNQRPASTAASWHRRLLRRASEGLLERLLGEQLEDGGWNCDAPKSKRSSFHSTICVLEGLLAYETARGPTAAVTHARARGESYLLDRRMFKSLSTGG